MTTPERDTLTTHEDIRKQFLSKRLGGSAALAQAIEMREVYADMTANLSEDEHERFINTTPEGWLTEDPLFNAETAFNDRVNEAFEPIDGYKLDYVTPTSISLVRTTMFPPDKPDVAMDRTRLIGEIEEDGSFTHRKEQTILLQSGHKSVTSSSVSVPERMALDVALNQLKEIDIMLTLESD